MNTNFGFKYKDLGIDEQVVEHFTQYILKRTRKKHLAETTIQTNWESIRHFKRFLKTIYRTKTGKPILNTTVSDFDKYVDYAMQTMKRSAAASFTYRVRRFLMFLFPILKQEYKRIPLPRAGRTPIKAEDLLTQEEIIKLLQTAKNPRDKAIIAFLADTGCRRHELTFIQLKHIKDEGTHMEIYIPKSKTPEGIRTVPLRAACGYIREWLNVHPQNNDPNAYLFISFKRVHGEYQKLIPSRIYKIVRNTAIDAQLDKRVYTHLLRHGWATKNLTLFSSKVVERMGGWKEGSEMIHRYGHLIDKDTLKAFKIVHGIEINDETKQESFEPIICSNCKFSNNPTSVLCGRCGLALNDETIFKQQQEKEAMQKKPMELINKLLEFLYEKFGPEELEDLIKESQ